jgi:hypothetical protein
MARVRGHPRDARSTQCWSVYGSSARKRARLIGDATRNDLAGLGDVALEGREVLVVDAFDALGGEFAEFAAAEEACHE